MPGCQPGKVWVLKYDLWNTSKHWCHLYWVWSVSWLNLCTHLLHKCQLWVLISYYIVFVWKLNQMGFHISVYICMYEHSVWMNCRVNKQQPIVLINNMTATKCLLADSSQHQVFSAVWPVGYLTILCAQRMSVWQTFQGRLDIWDWFQHLWFPLSQIKCVTLCLHLSKYLSIFVIEATVWRRDGAGRKRETPWNTSANVDTAQLIRSGLLHSASISWP